MPFEFASSTQTKAQSSEKCEQELTTNIWRHSDRPTFNIWKGKRYGVISGPGVGMLLHVRLTERDIEFSLFCQEHRSRYRENKEATDTLVRCPLNIWNENNYGVISCCSVEEIHKNPGGLPKFSELSIHPPNHFKTDLENLATVSSWSTKAGPMYKEIMRLFSSFAKFMPNSVCLAVLCLIWEL
jgi:hypothetical protein